MNAKKTIKYFHLKDCPDCKSKKDVKYLGVYVNLISNEILKLYVCSGTRKYSHDSIRKGTFKHYFSFSKLDHKTKLLDSQCEGYEDIKKDRIACPRSSEHIDKSRDHKYIYVIPEGNNGRYHCKNHTNSKYEFVYKGSKTIISLRKFIISISHTKFRRINEVYKDKDCYKVSKDTDKLVKFCIEIGLSHNIISRIFHSNQTTISRYAVKCNIVPLVRLFRTKSLETKLFNSTLYVPNLYFENLKDIFKK